MELNTIMLLAATTLWLSCCAALGFDLTVLHTNDIHSRFDEVTARGSSCKSADREAGKCFGGVARIKKAADDAKAEANGASIFVNAGDFFQVLLTHTCETLAVKVRFRFKLSGFPHRRSLIFFKYKILLT